MTLLYHLLHLKSKLALHKIAEYGYDGAGECGGYRGIDTAFFYEKFEHYIGEQYAGNSEHGIPEKLCKPMQVGLWEYYMPGKYKAQRKGDGERDNISHDMRGHDVVGQGEGLMRQ